MTFTRRAALGGVLATTTGCSALPFVGGDNETRASSSSKPVDLANPLAGPRINFEQAQKVMDELNIDGLVVGDGRSVYHLTGHWPLTSRMGFPLSTVAVLSRKNVDQPSLVISAFTYFYQLADHHKPEDYPVYIYTAPEAQSAETLDPLEIYSGLADQSANGREPSAAPFKMFRDRGSVSMDPVESQRHSLLQSALGDIQARANMRFALRQALDDAGVLSGTIATDLPELTILIEELAPKARLHKSDVALSRIRPIKSAAEVDLMRRAARVNAEAALAAVKQVGPGMTYRELRALFFAEAAQRNNIGTFMVVDRVSSDHYDREFVEGQAFLIDAVSAFDGYHGDYGRTVFIGEPKAPIRRATEAMGIAWNEVRDSLRPGMKFSEVSELGRSTMRKLGFNYEVPFSPHSVGLFHTDHLSNDATQAFMNDVVLQKNMIFSVDCPLLEAGIGGSAHLEDLVLITEQGGETINDQSDQTILV